MLQRRRTHVMVVETLLLAVVAFFLWSVVWWIADAAAHGTGLGRNVNTVITAVVCAILAWFEEDIHNWSLMVGWQRISLDAVVLLPAVAIVWHERGFSTALWSILLPVVLPLLVRAADRDEAKMQQSR